MPSRIINSIINGRSTGVSVGNSITIVNGNGSFHGNTGIIGSGQLVMDVRDVREFNTVELHGSPDVEIRIGTKYGVRVEAEDNIAPLVETVVQGSVLRISLIGSFSTRLPINIIVWMPPQLASRVEVHGSGDLTVTGVQCDSFEAFVRGSGDITISGTVESFNAAVHGSGDIDASKLNAESSAAEVQGSGDILICASRSLVANVRGSGDIMYIRKSPDMLLRKTVVGSGSVRVAHTY